MCRHCDAGASGVRRGGAEGQTQGVQAARGVSVREAAHVRLGATMASELAEKRSAIAWMGWVDHGRVVKGHFADTEGKLPLIFIWKTSAISADFGETS